MGVVHWSEQAHIAIGADRLNIDYTIPSEKTGVESLMLLNICIAQLIMPGVGLQ